MLWADSICPTYFAEETDNGSKLMWWFSGALFENVTGIYSYVIVASVMESYRYIWFLGSLIRCMVINFLHCNLLSENREKNASGWTLYVNINL